MILQSLLSGLVLFTSFSARTPNDDSITKMIMKLHLGLNLRTYISNEIGNES